MTTRSITHATFTLERTYPAPPARVFAAFSDPDAKAVWFGGEHDGFTTTRRAFDFRAGGVESVESRHPGGFTTTFDATYLNIVPDERIVYSYAMTLDGKPISASLTTIELVPEGSGTRLTMTEHGAFLDGFDNAEQREQGTIELLDALGAALEASASVR
ncbi:MAG TPA: SRPBCC family protein [Cellulomonas sp.]|uniref:SRPBCC family protein n=1 Tax=Cellulomonas sp. TaxID=40001 RepID=UPI002E334B9A|nr:SRPBCC family protein [Cellulomonas sp.]HEX5333957.1 SRPBCC family protein [Cellulomonas sp.]